MKQRLPILLAMAVVLCLAGLSRAERPHIYAIKGVRIVVAPGKVIEKGNVIIRDGLIQAAGANAAIPADAVEIDGTGKTVYAGLIDASTHWGIRATAAPAGGGARGGIAGLLAAATPAPAAAGANHPLSRVHPELDVRTLIVPFELPPTPAGGGGRGGGGGGRGGAAATPAPAAVTGAEQYRNVGFTAGLTAPDNGVFRGSSAVIDLRDDAPTTDIIVRDEVAQHIALAAGGGFGGGGGYPGSLMGQIAAIRQAFYDAQRYETWEARYKKNPAGMKRPEFSPTFAALEPVLHGERMVIFETEAFEDIVSADKIAREFKLAKCIMGADNNAQEGLDRVKATGRTLILSAAMPARPRVDDPDDAFETDTRDLRRFVDAPQNAKKLYDAKIPFVLSARGVTIADFPRNIRRMIEAGLPAEAALKALTTAPAELLGVEKVMGTVEAGKIANLVMTDGDLFGANTHVVRTFVDGREYVAPPPAPAAGGGRGGPGGPRPTAAESNENEPFGGVK